MEPVSFARALRRASVTLLGLAGLTAPAAAHSGTTHAGTPHWLLLALFGLGTALMVGGVVGGRRGVSRRAGGASLIAGAPLAVFGAIGLVELQVVGQSGPELVDIYPLLSLVVGMAMAVGGYVYVLLRHPEKPRYAVLGTVLAAWVAYPAVFPDSTYTNPAGYLVVLALPLVLGYVLVRDARGTLQGLRLQTKPKLAGVAAGLLMSVFFAFSGGTMSFNPDEGVGAPTEFFLQPFDVASPLVVWPAVEWYVPAVDFTGYLSVGTLLVMGVLGGLVGLNAAVLVQQWGASGAAGSVSGSLAASGATACCCCAPAFYGVISVFFGTAATPIYWSFMIPSSPVGGAFFSLAVVLLLRSFLQSSGASADASPRERSGSEGLGVAGD